MNNLNNANGNSVINGTSSYDMPGNIKFLTVISLLILSCLSAGWTISVKPLGNHEAFVAVTSREMLADGYEKWVLPTYNDHLRLKKTPLSYWLVNASVMLLGKMNEFTVRLPSVLLAVASVMGVLYFVNVWLGFRIAALSAGVWSISLGFIRYSHNARPEIALAVFTAISLLSFYTAMNEDSRRRQYIFMTFFWLSFGLAMLAKGPAPLPLIAPAVFLYFLVFGEWKKISKCMPILGPVIFLLIVLPWPLMVWQAKPDVLSVWNREFIDRGTGDFASGDKSFFYYIPVFFALSAPWVGFVPGALFSIFYKSRWGQRHKPLVWLWLWFVSQIVVMSIIGGKRQHYILPAMPALCILVGIVLEDVVFTRKAHSQSDRRGYFIGHLAVIYGAIIFGPVYVYFNQPEIFAQVLIIDAGVLVVTAVITILFTSKHKTGAVVSIFAGYILIVMISYIIFVNPNDSGIQARRLAVNLRKIVKDEQLAAYKDVSGRVVFYFGKPIPVAGSVEEIEDYYNRSNYVIAFGDHIEELENNTDMHQMRYWQEGQMRQTGMEAAGLFHKSANGSEGPQPAESQP